MRVAASPGRLRCIWRLGEATWKLRGRCSIAVRQLKHGIAKVIRPYNAPSIAAGIESRSCWWSGGPLQLAGLDRLANSRYVAQRLPILRLRTVVWVFGNGPILGGDPEVRMVEVARFGNRSQSSSRKNRAWLNVYDSQPRQDHRVSFPTSVMMPLNGENRAAGRGPRQAS